MPIQHINIPRQILLTIIISHLHPDHYGDLLSIASTSFVFNRLGYLNERIKVYIPKGDKIKVRYKYNILTQTIFIGIYPYKVVSYNPDSHELRLRSFFGKEDDLIYEKVAENEYVPVEM